MRTVCAVLAVSVVLASPVLAQEVSLEAVTTVLPGASRANVEIGAKGRVEIAAQPVICTAAAPTDCPALPEVTGFADSTTLLSAAQLAGRTLIVTNTGTGVLVLKAQGASSAAKWRLSERRVLRAGESVALVYDGAAARWSVVGLQP